MADHELPVGSDKGKILAFFKRHEMGYTFDQVFERYEAAVPYAMTGWREGHTLGLNVYVDKAGRVTMAEVEETWTSL